MWIACISVGLTACRFGFDELSGSGGGDDVITTPPVPGIARVLVIGEDGEANAGQPVSGAYVVAIEQDGASTTVRTGDDGTAEIEIDGNTALHVARPLANGAWALSSFRALDDGAYMIVGGHPPQATSTARGVTVELPPFPMGYDEAWVTGPTRCIAQPGWAMSTSVPLLYDPRCEGETVELYALAWDIHVPIGSVTLTDGTAIDRTASAWVDLRKVGIDYINVPAEVTDTYALLALPTATGDRIPLGENSDVPNASRFVGLGFEIPPSIPGMAIIHAFESPTGVRVLYQSIDSWPGTFEIDASTLPPPPPGWSVDRAISQVQWTAGAAADADAYWASTDITIGAAVVHWNAFGPAGATQVKYPVLPAELAHLSPTPQSSWGASRIVLASLSDFDYAGAVELLDRDIFWWWSAGEHLPTGTVSLVATSLPP